MNYLKKHKFILIIVVVTIIRFLLSYRLPSFYIANLGYDDALMIRMMKKILDGQYLGLYNNIILTKGIVFPLLISIIKYININYSIVFTILHIGGCLLLTNSLKSNINNKVYLVIIYIILLFNPVSYSSELFQRLYRTSLSVTELLFFLSFIIRIINDKGNIIFNYLMLGFMISIMLLTREDTIWVMIIYGLLIIFKSIKKHKLKHILVYFIPCLILFLSLNIYSMINKKYYDIYTYNELKDSSFKDFYVRLKSIKDDNKKYRVSVTKRMLYKLCDESKTFGFERRDIDMYYENYKIDDEIENNNIIWYLRNMIYVKFQLLNGKDANEYFRKLADEMDVLFKEGKLEKQLIIPSVNLNTLSIYYLKDWVINILKTVSYTTSYKDIKTFDEFKENIDIKYDDAANAYSVMFLDRYGTANIINNNHFIYEFFRIIYRYFTIVFSIFSVYAFFKNVTSRNKNSLILLIILMIYGVIILGVSYTHTTSFNAIRYIYLGDVYILQSLFIMLNIYIFFTTKKYV